MANLQDIDSALQVAFDVAKELEDQEALIRSLSKFLVSNPEIGKPIIKERCVKHRTESVALEGRIRVGDENIFSYHTHGWTWNSGLDSRPSHSKVTLYFQKEARRQLEFPNYKSAMKFCQNYFLEQGYFFFEEDFEEDFDEDDSDK